MAKWGEHFRGQKSELPALSKVTEGVRRGHITEVESFVCKAKGFKLYLVGKKEPSEGATADHQSPRTKWLKKKSF